MHVILVFVAIAGLGCGSQPTPPTTPSTLPTDPRCPDPAPTPTATCLQDCGPPVARDTDPPPPFRWATKEEVASREQHGCPRCLDGSVAIAAPGGERAVSSLVTGDLVFTEDARGQRVIAPIVRVARISVPSSHRVFVFTLADGRTVSVSGQHPLAGAGVVGNVLVGGSLDGSDVIDRQLVAPTGGETWDILPAGETGHYWANGVRLGSTLRR